MITNTIKEELPQINKASSSAAKHRATLTWYTDLDPFFSLKKKFDNLRSH